MEDLRQLGLNFEHVGGPLSTFKSLINSPEAGWERPWYRPESGSSLPPIWLCPTRGITPSELALLAFLKLKCLAIACKYWNRSYYSHKQGKETPWCFPKTRQNGALRQCRRERHVPPQSHMEYVQKVSRSLDSLLPAPHLFSEMLVQRTAEKQRFFIFFFFFLLNKTHKPKPVNSPNPNATHAEQPSHNLFHQLP